jgi:hypothetical protein
MNTKNLLIASLAGGLISLVLVNTPYLDLVNVLACLGFWIGPVLAVWLYQRLTGGVTLGEAAVTGMLAGAWHGVLGILLSPLGLAGAGHLLNDFRGVVPAESLAGLEASLTGLGGVLVNLAGALIDVVFGLVGGMAGGLLFGGRRLPQR